MAFCFVAGADRLRANPFSGTSLIGLQYIILASLRLSDEYVCDTVGTV